MDRFLTWLTMYQPVLSDLSEFNTKACNAEASEPRLHQANGGKLRTAVTRFLKMLRSAPMAAIRKLHRGDGHVDGWPVRAVHVIDLNIIELDAALHPRSARSPLLNF